MIKGRMTKADWGFYRRWLADKGEPCGGFLHQCHNKAAHLAYSDLPEKHKDLMMREREAEFRFRKKHNL